MSNKGITGTDSEVDAEELAKNLGIRLVDMPITEPVSKFKSLLDSVRSYLDKWWGSPPAKTTTEDNIQARARMVNIWAVANEYKAVAIATCDKSELYMGYTTIGGDMLGELAPISDVPKEKVRSLARWINAHRTAIPQRTIEKPSGAELKRDPTTGKIVTAEQDLMPYPFLDEIIYRYEARHQSKAEMLNADFWFEKHGQDWTAKNKLDLPDAAKSFTKDNPVWLKLKKIWLDKFFSLDNISQIKRKLSAVSIIVSDHGITKSEYHRDVTCAPLGKDGRTPEEIRAMLQSV